MCLKRTILILLALLYSIHPFALQAQKQKIIPGTRVRITAPTYFIGTLIGVVKTVTPDSLTMTHGNTVGPNPLKSGTTQLPLNALTKIEISRGHGHSDAVVTGGVIGLFSGLGIIGILSKTAFSGEKSLALIFIAPLTIVSSTLAGILINRRERWTTLSLDQ